MVTNSKDDTKVVACGRCGQQIDSHEQYFLEYCPGTTGKSHVLRWDESRTLPSRIYRVPDA